MTSQRSVARWNWRCVAFLDEFFIKLVASSGVNDDQVGGRTGLQPVPYDAETASLLSGSPYTRTVVSSKSCAWA